MWNWCSVNQTSITNSAFHPSGVDKWVPTLAGKAKVGVVHSISGWTRGVQVKLWDPLRMRAMPECFRGVFTTRRYTNRRLPLPSPSQYKTCIVPLTILDSSSSSDMASLMGSLHVYHNVRWGSFLCHCWVLSHSGVGGNRTQAVQDRLCRLSMLCCTVCTAWLCTTATHIWHLSVLWQRA